MNILEIKNLSYCYDDNKKALNGINVDFQRGKTTAILGGNGAGKSTLFLLLNGILKPDDGEVFYDGQKIEYTKQSIRRLRKEIGIVFQDPDDQLFSASVYQDISFGAVNLGLDESEVRHRVESAMEKMGITHLRDKPTHALSFGQKKRVAVAGVLVMKPNVMILDEPTAGLDPMGVSELMRLLQDICQKDGTTILISTHDIDVVPVYADYIYVIDKGNLLTQGTPREIFSNPTLLREHQLRIPRVSHLLEILKKRDGFDVDFSASTIGQVRAELNRFFHS